MKILFSTFLFCFFSFLGFSQVSIRNFPQTNQIFQRNTENQARIEVSGKASNSSSKINLKVFLNGNPVFDETQNQNFNFVITVQAGKNNYFFKLYENEKEIKVAEKVTCGDIYVFYGQSNAIGEDKIAEYQPSNDDFLRFFHVYDYSSKTGSWLITSQSYERFNVGLFPMEFQKIISQNQNIPVGVIQAAVGGMGIGDITNHDINNHSNPYSIYGKMLSKLQMSGAKESAKYMIFRHGETDATGESQSLDYGNAFERLYNLINSDLPTLTKFYNYQTNVTGGTTNKFAGILREFQRKSKYKFSKISTLTSIGNSGYDGIHYSHEGYLEAAKNLSRIVESEVYGRGNSAQIYHPDIKKASYTNNQIVLEFDEGQEIIFPENKNIDGQERKLSDYFLVDGKTGLVNSGFSSGNKVFLNLNNYQNPKKITYLPSVFVGISLTVHGFLIKNIIGMGAFSFEDFEIGNGGGGDPVTLNRPVLSVSTNQVSVNISWNEVAPQTTYHLEKSTDNQSFTEIYQTQSLSFQDNDISFNRKYFYRAWAEKNGVKSEKSDVKEIDLGCLKDISIKIMPEISKILAGNSISAFILVSKSKDLTLSSKNVVDLEDGFEAADGSNFIAEIGGCQNFD